MGRGGADDGSREKGKKFGSLFFEASSVSNFVRDAKIDPRDLMDTLLRLKAAEEREHFWKKKGKRE